MAKIIRAFKQWLGLLLMALLLLQIYFVARVALMAVIDPSSTAFELSLIHI